MNSYFPDMPSMATRPAPPAEERRIIDDVDPGHREPVLTFKEGIVEITLSIAEQRKIVECEAKERCERIWMNEKEAAAIEGLDWTLHRLADGRWALWRKWSSLQEGPAELFKRIITDDVL